MNLSRNRLATGAVIALAVILSFSIGFLVTLLGG